jgi:hypothetical protein
VDEPATFFAIVFAAPHIVLINAMLAYVGKA